ncbi:hypothetical protein MUP07_03670 [Candidatus Bathyarchaeota archaeon]|nr:hypothetical protein [Candidatus Bathyarchaeota archaeon]
MKMSRILLITVLFAGMCLMTVQPAGAAASAVVQNDSMWIDILGQVRIGLCSLVGGQRFLFGFGGSDALSD